MAKGSADDIAKQKSRRAINKLSRNAATIGDFLVRVVEGKETEDKIYKDGTTHKVPAGLGERIQAAKLYKEMVLDKLTPDVKQDPRQRGNKEGRSMVAALKELHEASLK